MADVPMIKVGQLYGCQKGEGTEFPIAFFEAHREQAYRNHGQSLERLAERGGLGWGEAIAILCSNDNRYTDVAHNREWLRRRFEEWQAANAASVTLTEGGDAKQAPGASLSGAVGEAETPNGGSHA